MYAIYSYAKCTFCGCSSSPTLSLPLLLVVCTLSIQPNDSLSKYISRASPARGDTFVSISFHRLICYKITFSCLINFYALKHTHSYTHSLSRSHTNRRLQQAFTCVDIAFCIRGIFSLSSPICEICAPGAIFPYIFMACCTHFLRYSSIFYVFFFCLLCSTSISGGWHN